MKLNKIYLASIIVLLSFNLSAQGPDKPIDANIIACSLSGATWIFILDEEKLSVVDNRTKTVKQEPAWNTHFEKNFGGFDVYGMTTIREPFKKFLIQFKTGSWNGYGHYMQNGKQVKLEKCIRKVIWGSEIIGLIEDSNL